MASAVRVALKRWDERRLFRMTMPVEPVCALDWLRAQPAAPATFWHGRGEQEDVATLGVALRVRPTLSDVQHAVARLPADARLYGALPFDSMSVRGEEWAGLGGDFVLPRVEVRVRDDSAVLAVSAAPGTSPDAVLRDVERLIAPVFTAAGRPDFPIARCDTPPRAAWESDVQEVLGRIEAGQVSKVVLARRATFTFEGPVDALALLGRLREVSPGAYHVLHRTADGRAFVSVTPERLVRVEKRCVVTEAVAGTRRRGDAGADACRLRDALNASEKDRREHAFVRDALIEALAPLATDLHSERAPGQLEAARVRHLRTRLEADLRDGVAPLAVLTALHPTPAVGGTSTARALRLIREMEPFDRGLYAGPAGWIGPDAAEFAVGIRSGLLDGRRLHLYSGAGVVAGSDPAAEWEETEAKLGAFIDALGLD